jgi:hypothetical protein
VSAIDDAALGALVRREVGELHAFFEGWIGGELPQDADTFARAEGALDDPFFIVDPGGTIADRDATLTTIYRDHSARPGFTISIRDTQLRWRRDELLGASYQEWQRGADGAERGRLSSVVFRLDVRAPSGLRWLQVHETWLT